ncbi:MAG: hypothetical protein E7333_00770 [Clostridiales bacterium]|nr:hypothetical protein [Clostridiales bacterium]
MSFYSYKNANNNCCPGTISGNAIDGLQEKVCVQVKRVYDSALMQEQLDRQVVTITSYAQVNTTCQCNTCGCQEVQEPVTPTSAPVPPITFESCRSTSTQGTIRNLTVDRLCDRPCFARVRCTVDVPIDILFTDSRNVEYIGKGVVSVNRDVLLSIPDESIVPYSLEAMVSAICVAGTYLGNNQFQMTICVTIILKVLADVEILIPSYGFCPIPPAEEFAESVCDEFFSLPLFPPASLCNEGTVAAGGLTNTCNNGCNCGNTCCRRNG